MTSLQIAPAKEEGIESHFEIVICDSPAQFSEWEDNTSSNDFSLFLPNTNDPENMNRFATILFRKDHLTDEIIAEQSERAGKLFAEIMTSIQDFPDKRERNTYFLECCAFSTHCIEEELKNFISEHYPIAK